MCGIVGAFGPSAIEMEEGIRSAIKFIGHRGPDGEGLYKSPDGKCLLGHVRLAILDLSSAASQPMCKVGSALAFNGEIYNHQTLRPQLEQKGWAFTSSSDTETLLAGLCSEGVGFLDKPSGMFAGAWYNEQNESLVLFRDPLGIKPLYLTTLPDSTVIFCSEISGLLKTSTEICRKIKPQVLSCYLRYENYPQNETLIETIKSFIPGEIRLYYSDFHWQEYKLPSKSNLEESLNIPMPELVAQTQMLIEKAVQSHLISDVPVGVYLSGGIDSSLVAAIAARHINRLTAFTGYFEDKDSYYDERPLSHDVASQNNIDLNEVCIRPMDFKENFDDLIIHLGQPRMGMGAFSQYMVAKEAGKKLKVLLSGHGGDELFAGYNVFKALWVAKNGWLSPLNWKVLANLREKEIPWVFYIVLENIIKSRIPFAPKLINKVGIPFNESLEANFYDSSKEPLKGLSDYYQRLYLPGLLLVEDSISMAHSLETRMPLWCPELIRWSNRIRLKDKRPLI